MPAEVKHTGPNRKDMSEIKNPRLLQMMDHISHYDIEIKHIAGEHTKVATDYQDSNLGNQGLQNSTETWYKQEEWQWQEKGAH